MALATRPKPKGIQHKKRQARHHRQTKHYVKSYLPYLPMLAIIGIAVSLNSLWSNGNVLGIRRDYSPARLLSATNQLRSHEKEAGLSLNPQLQAAAQAKAENMAQANYWAHTSPTGQTPWSFIANSGYQYQAAGENLAYGFDDAEAAIKGWLNSPEHRANMLDANYRDVGFGVAQAVNFQGKGPQTIIVAEYATPASAGSEANPQLPTAEIASRPVSRLETLGGTSAALLAVAAVVGAAFAIFIMRHTYRIHKVLVYGERFIVKHPLLDIIAVAIFAFGALLTRVSGVIG